jgi:hypothetical protein
MRTTLALLLLAVALAGCAPAAELPATTAEPTATPIDTPPTATAAPTEVPPTATPTEIPATPTPVPLSALDLEPVMLEANAALPPPLLADFIHDAPTHIRQDVLGDLPAPDNYIMQELYHPESEIGGAVIVYVYDDLPDVRSAYMDVSGQLDGMGYDLGVSNPDGVGERATMEELNDRVYLVFPRCHALVFVWATGARPFDVLAYGEELDAALGPLVCPALP